MLKHKTSAVILLSLLMMLSVSCRQEISEKPELDVSAPDIETEIVETVGDWQTDPTGTFSYLKVNPHLQFDMFFEEGMVFHDNMFIYEVYDSSAEPVKMYGYMDTDFNKMTEPISLEPNVFMYGLTRIVTDDSSYILSKDLQSVKEHYPGCVFVDDTLMKVDWGKEIYSDPFMVTGIDLETYLVPCKVEPGAGNELASPVYGYKTVQDAYINGTPAEENFVIPAVYQDVRLFCDGMAAVKANDKWGFIDMEGNVIVECKYVDAISLTHGVAAVYDEVGYNDLSFGSWVLIDTSGNELIPGTSFSGTDKFQPNKFIDNLTFIGGGNYKLLNSDGEILTDWLTYEDDGPPLFHEDYIVLNNTGGKYFYDKTGHLAFPTRFSDARDFSDGLAAVYNNKTQKWGYINTNWERVIPYAYSRTTDFSRGYAYVSIDKDNLSITKDPGYIIDRQQNEYLKDLNLISMTKFNEDGYALAYAMEVNEYWVNINKGMSKSIKAEYVLETRDDKVYYMIHIEQP